MRYSGRLGSRTEASSGKCEFGQTTTRYLGHTVTQEGVFINTDNIRAVMDCPAPKNLSELRSFNSVVQYYGNYTPHLAEIGLYKLYQKGAELTWSPACQQAFDTNMVS